MSGKNSTFLNNNPPTVDDVWLNMVTTEVKNFITGTGQTPTDADLFQIAKGVANAVSVSNFYTDSGTTNAYVLTPISPFKAPDAYRNGMEVRFRAGNANNGASTAIVNGLGVITIKKADGVTDVVAGEIPSTQDTKLRFNGSVFILSNDSVLGASQPEVVGATVTGKYVSPATLAGLFSAASLSPTNASITIPILFGGVFVDFTLKFGTATINTTPTPIIFTNAFPNSILLAGAFSRDQPSNTNSQRLYSQSETQSQVSFVNPRAAGDVYWFAIGI